MRWNDFLSIFRTKPKPVPQSPTPAPREVDRMIIGKGTPRGIRNNNPGNIRGTGPNGSRLDPWKGQIDWDQQGFCIFATAELGLRALALLMLIYQARHGLETIRQLIARWAPATENNVNAYVNAVCNECGVKPQQTIHLARDRLLLANLVRAIVRHENGVQPYSEELIDAGVRLAMENHA